MEKPKEVFLRPTDSQPCVLSPHWHRRSSPASIKYIEASRVQDLEDALAKMIDCDVDDRGVRIYRLTFQDMLGIARTALNEYRKG